MALRCRWSGKALADISHIEEYIAQDNPTASIEVTKRLVLAIEAQLTHYPNSGRAGRVLGTRELIISGTPYIAAYRVQQDVVEVLRVLHTAQRWPESLT